MKIADDKGAGRFNATDPNLKGFKERGGKLLLYHGWSDAAIPPTNTINYYESVVAKMGRRRQADFVELFMVPGMQHCGGGPGPNDFGALVPAGADAEHSMIKALERWVEKGRRPRRLSRRSIRPMGIMRAEWCGPGLCVPIRWSRSIRGRGVRMRRVVFLVR